MAGSTPSRGPPWPDLAERTVVLRQRVRPPHCNPPAGQIVSRWPLVGAIGGGAPTVYQHRSGGRHVPLFGWVSAILDAEAGAPAAAVQTRGYNPETWKQLGAIGRVTRALPRGFPLSIRVLRAGPCPNTRAVYFSLTNSGPGDEEAGAPVGFYLGSRSDLTRIQAGAAWDKEIERANRRAHLCLRPGREALNEAEVPPAQIREYYNRRLRETRRILRGKQLPSSSLRMKVKPLIKGPLPVRIMGKPDGLWIAVAPTIPSGGVFDAKLTLPRADLVRHTMVSYALLAEHQFQTDFNVGFVLHWDGGTNEPLLSRVDITEADRIDTLENLDKVTELLALTTLGGRRRRHPVRWSEYLKKPDLPPEGPSCPDCVFNRECRPQPEVPNG
jgi:hypothetical protein